MVEPGVDFEAEATRIQSIYRGQAPPFFLEGQDGVISDWIPMFWCVLMSFWEVFFAYY